MGVVSKRRAGAGGCLAGGKPFSRGALYLLLQNRIYRGEITHQDVAYPGQHNAIIDAELWRIAQDRLATNRQERRLAAGAEAPSLLAGLIFDADGAHMTPTHAAKGAKRYRYYVSASLLNGGRVANSSGIRVSAGDIEGLVLDRLRQLLASRSELGAALAPLDLDATGFDAALNKASDLSRQWLTLTPIDIAALVRRIVEKAQVNVNDITLQLNRGELASALIGDDKAPCKRTDPMLLSIDATLKRAGKGKRLVIDNENARRDQSRSWSP